MKRNRLIGFFELFGSCLTTYPDSAKSIKTASNFATVVVVVVVIKAVHK